MVHFSGQVHVQKIWEPVSGVTWNLELRVKHAV